MGTGSKREALGEQLKRLQSEDRSALCLLWFETYRTPPPKGWSMPMLRRALAAEFQGQVLGTLNKAELKELRSFAPSAPSLMPDSDEGPKPAISASRQHAPAASPGTKLIRTWHGRTYEVTVLEGGKAKLGDETYRSLSAVATAITGTRWSGPLFFGLRDRKQREVTRHRQVERQP